VTTNRWTWHGGGLAAARTHFGTGEEDWLDLSTGINPHAWSGADTIAIDWRALPEEGALRALEEAAAAHFGCDADHVCAVPGTEVGLRLCGDLLVGPAHHIAPTYRTHTVMLPGSEALPVEHLGHAHGTTLILANPNNPDGRLLERRALMEMLDHRGQEGWLILDEAFADCHPEHGFAAAVADERKLVIFRSFGKFFGLAGLRLGFVIAPRPIIARLRGKLGAWPVSAAALAIGTAAYRDAAWIAAMRRQLDAEAGELDVLLKERGYTVLGQCPLFRLIACDRAQPLFEHLARHAILTRPFDQHPGWLRIGLPGSHEALFRFITAMPDHA